MIALGETVRTRWEIPRWRIIHEQVPCQFFGRTGVGKTALEGKRKMALPRDKHFMARVIDRKELSEDLWLVRVDPGGPFQFKAGQYATLGVDHGDKRIERAYSIVSSPYEEGFLEFFVELVPQGELTPHLYKLHKGDTLFCRKIAKGRFTLDLRSGRTQSFVAGHGDRHCAVCELRADLVPGLEIA